MLVVKCDLCKKNIKKEPVTAGVGYFPRVQLCEKCGAPIIDFLAKNNFIKDNKEKKYVNK